MQSQVKNTMPNVIRANVAEKDIVCYKVMFKNKQNNTTESPYQNITFPSEGSVSVPRFKYKLRTPDYRFFGIHLHADLKGAEHVADVLNSLPGDMICCHGVSHKEEMLIVECVIPKGTRYYETDFDGYGAYVAKKVKVTSKTVMPQVLMKGNVQCA